MLRMHTRQPEFFLIAEKNGSSLKSHVIGIQDFWDYLISSTVLSSSEQYVFFVFEPRSVYFKTRQLQNSTTEKNQLHKIGK